MSQPKWAGGRNIALKVPQHQFEATVDFYANVLGLQPWPEESQSVSFVFGSQRLWIDLCPGLSQAEIWLEVVTDDVEGAAQALAERGVARCDAIEPLPEDSRGFWISSPCQIIHLVTAPETDA